MGENENEIDELDVFTLADEDGVEAEYALLTIVDLEEEGQYAVFAPVEQVESDDPDLDLYAFHYREVGEDDVALDPVEDEDLLALVFAKAEQVLFGDDEE